MNYCKAEFISSYFQTTELPLERKPEIVFVGRSNAGKSSMINRLVGRKNLAFTGSTPGKTASINYYSVDNTYFVDLPGYGYAQRSKTERKGWGNLIETYFNLRRDVRLVIMLVDIRIGVTEDDMLMYNWLMSGTTPFCVVAAKADKLSASGINKAVDELSKKLKMDVIPFSATKGIGDDRLREIIDEMTEEKEV